VNSSASLATCASLEDILITHELAKRPARAPDHHAENRALNMLASEMTASPGTVLQTLTALVLELCRAGSAGVSILDSTGEVFVWPALAGPVAHGAGSAAGSIARTEGPCGIVVERDAALLFDRPGRRFPALRGSELPILETLMVPFHVHGQPRGTVWAVSHDPERHFDAEDVRLLSALGRFAGIAYQMSVALQEAETARAELEQRVAEEQRAKLELRAAHDHITELLESLSDAFYTLDPDWRFTYANRRAEERWGIPREQILGRRLYDVFPAMIDSPSEPMMRKAMQERIPLRLETLSATHGHWAEMNIHPMSAGGLAIYLRDIDERKRAEERQTLLAREVDHRAKNALTVVQAALRLTQADSLEAYSRAVEGRVAALARAQTLLAMDRWSGADLRALLHGELEPFLGRGPGGAGQRVHLEGPQVVLTASMAQPLSMAVHELATNAVKHGALSAALGGICVSWQLEGAGKRTLRLRWAEHGGPPVAGPPSQRGFGSRVLDATIRRQMGGTVSLCWEAAGLTCEITVPLDGRKSTSA